MRILLLHNRYQQPGGEDVVARSEQHLLRQYGHDVRLLEVDNAEIEGFLNQLKTALGVIYSPQARRRVAKEIAAFKPDVVHIHNFFPLFSPSVYYACRDAGVPVVQTLHNYRLVCPNALLFRDGHICEECVGQSFAWSGIAHGCYRNSRVGTASIAMMQAVHRFGGTWDQKVDLYIALTEFSRKKLADSGLPADKIVVKPNFVHPDPGSREGAGEYALFVGRLSPEKGLHTLLTTWARLKERVPLTVVGDGPLRAELQEQAGNAEIRFAGWLQRDQIIAAMKRARFLIFPSEYYECFPVTLLEAFACGVPVIASRLGAMEEIVVDGHNGLHFGPGDTDDLAAKVKWAWSHPREMEEMGRAARREYETKYTLERNYQLLMEIYDRALQRSSEKTQEPIAVGDRS